MRTARIGGAPSSPNRPGARSNGDVVALCTYLAIPAEVFAAQQDRYFQRLGELLAFHGAVASAADVGPDTFRDAVVRFQRDQGLPVDGIPGEESAWALNLDWALTRLLPLVDVEADRHTPPALSARAYGGCADERDGRGHWQEEPWRVRSDVACAAAALRTELNAAGVPMTSAGGAWPLNAHLPASRSAISVHYIGVAIDLALGGATCSNRRVSGRFLDVTAVAKRHGFATVGPRLALHADYLTAWCWHLQFEQVFVPWISQFGAEILTIADYSVSDLEAQPRLWENRKRLFQRGRGGWW